MISTSCTSSVQFAFLLSPNSLVVCMSLLLFDLTGEGYVTRQSGASSSTSSGYHANSSSGSSSDGNGNGSSHGSESKDSPVTGNAQVFVLVYSVQLINVWFLISQKLELKS